MGKRAGKAMNNLPKSYISAMRELQEENERLRLECEKLKNQLNKLTE